MNERCSAVFLNKLPSKEKDLGSFTIACDIGQLHINNALADLGASISLMPYTMYKKLGLGEPKATRMSLELTDRRMPFGLCNTPVTFQRCMTTIFHDMVEDFMEVFTDDFLVFGNSFDYCLANLDRMLARCIDVDRAKIDVIDKLLYPTNVKGVRSFLGHAEFYQSKQDTKPRLIRWVLLLQGFDIKIKDKKGAANLAADHFSRLENLDLGTFIEDEITDEFPNEHLMILKAELNDDESWYADYDEPYAFRLCPDNVMRRCIAGSEIIKILAHCHYRPIGGHHSASITRRKVYESGFFWPSIFKDAKDYVMRCDACQRSRNISSRSEMPQNNI
ncbi:reverse transcriptase domain-containing protein [Tanacetum coccineum]